MAVSHLGETLKSIPCTAAYIPISDLIIVSPTDTLISAFQRLCTYKVLATPIIDSDGTIKGSFSVIDMIFYLSDTFDQESVKGSVNSTFDFFSLAIARREFSGIKINSIAKMSNLDPVIMLAENKNLKDVIDALATKQARRAIIHESSESAPIKGMLSQGQLLRYMYEHRANTLKSDFWDTKISDYADLADRKNVITVNLSTKVCDAFRQMRDWGVSAIGVVDDVPEKGKTGAVAKLVGNISATDVKLLGYDLRYFKALGFSTNEYLGAVMPKDHASGEVVCVKEGGNDTMGDIIGKLVENHIHRLYVIDNEGKPVGVISMTDILLALVKYIQ